MDLSPWELNKIQIMTISNLKLELAVWAIQFRKFHGNALICGSNDQGRVWGVGAHVGLRVEKLCQPRIAASVW